MARRILLWMFVLGKGFSRWEYAAKVGAQLLLLSVPVLITRLFWGLSNGWAACAGMMTFGGVAFIFTTWYRWNVLEPRMTDEQKDRIRLYRRARRHCVKQDMIKKIGKGRP